MRRLLIVALVVFITALAATVVLWRLKGAALLGVLLPVPPADELFPPAPSMPAAVSTPVDDMLAQYEAFLRTKASAVFSALRPGLTNAAMDRLEQQHNLKLTADLRALYRWRNGTAPGAEVNAFPDHRFIPIDLALANREALRKQVKAANALQRQAYAAMAGQRDGWVGLLVDLAGDGYFFEPGRSESQGSFFFCFAQEGMYVFYPRFGNYLAAVVEGEKSGIFTVGQYGVETRDFEKADQLMRRYGAGPRR